MQKKRDQPEIRAPVALLGFPLMFSSERAAFLCFMSAGYLATVSHDLKKALHIDV